MDKGSLSERYLTRSVLKHIQRQKQFGRTNGDEFESNLSNLTSGMVTGAVGMIMPALVILCLRMAVAKNQSLHGLRQ